MGSNITNFQDNVSGAENKSQGIELSTNWTDNDRLNMGFNYTFTKSYSVWIVINQKKINGDILLS